MGRYLPPDIEGTSTTGNALHRRRAPGQTAKQRRTIQNPDGTTSTSSTPSQTVRFEMPFPIWCGSCPKPTIIGQGVRFNAQKSRAGHYHSTTIWRFDMRHAACGGDIAMQTDPKNTAYVVLSGATKRAPQAGDTDDLVSSTPGASSILTDPEKESLRQNAFSNLEKTIADRQRLIQADERISSLHSASSRHWDDPYAQNQRLRNLFRVGRKQREADAAVAEEIQDRMGLEVELLPESEDDARRAALVDFAPVGGHEYGVDDEGALGGRRTLSKPLFKTVSSTKTGGTKNRSPLKRTLKSERVAAKRKEDFMAEVMDNTRAIQDPFLNAKDTKGPARLPGVKRKREPTIEEQIKQRPSRTLESHGPTSEIVGTASSGQALVDYDSD